MKTTGRRKGNFDRMARYRMAAFIFGVVYLVLITRWLLGWPDVPTAAIRAFFLTLTTLGMVLLVYNLCEASVAVYKGRRRIDKMLDERRTPDGKVP